jgi:TetR/AcrR family transcriptional regulator, transcriptional repressor for nem operon
MRCLRIAILSVNRPMKTVKQPRALETREKILEAAARLFALKGYHDAKLEEVLDTAQVTKGAFFHHFRDREDLGFAVLNWHMDRRRRVLEAIEQELPPARQAGPLQQVFRRLDAIQEMVRRREDCKGGCVIGNMSTALSDCHDGFRQRLAECFDEMAQDFIPHLEAATRRGTATRRANTRELARFIVTVIEGAIMQARTFGDPKLIPRQFAYLKEHVKKSLEA